MLVERSFIPVEDRTDSASLRYQSAMQFLNETGFWPLPDGLLQEVSNAYSEDLKLGIRGEASSLAMIPTFLCQIETEKLLPGDEALVIEIGGTNVRGAIVSIDENKQAFIKKGKEQKGYYRGSEITQRRFNSPDDFFDTVLAGIQIEELLTGSKPKALAIIYSFPGQAIETGKGIDVRSPDELPKGFFIQGMHKEPVGEAFLRRLHAEYGVEENMPLVVLNDTPAVLFGAKIGGVVGTGINFAVSVDGQIYNTESGGAQGIPDHGFATLVDIMSDKPGKQLAEKQISGMYLEQQLNFIVGELEERGFITYKMAKEFRADFISDILGVSKSSLEKKMCAYTDTYSYAILTAVAGRLRHTSAQLVGAMIGGVIQTFPNEFPHDKRIQVPIEGSVFWKIPGYKELVKKYIKKIIGKGYQVEFVEKKHAGILGAGAAALDIARRKTREIDTL